MAAFSSDTKRVKVGNQIAPNNFRPSNPGGSPTPRFSSHFSGGPRNPEMTAPAAQQFQINNSQDQRMYQAQAPYQNFGPQSNPPGMVRPFSMHHRNPPEAWNGAGVSAYYSVPGSGPRPSGSPGFGSPGTPGFGPPGVSGLRPLAGPQFRHQGSPGSNAGQGRGQWHRHSPSPYSVHGSSPSPSSRSGRGGGHWSMRPGSGRKGGRGRGSHGHSAEDKHLGPERFYNGSMIEDPWKFLKPVIWNGVDAPRNHMNTHITIQF